MPNFKQLAAAFLFLPGLSLASEAKSQLPLRDVGSCDSLHSGGEDVLYEDDEDPSRLYVLLGPGTFGTCSLGEYRPNEAMVGSYQTNGHTIWARPYSEYLHMGGAPVSTGPAETAAAETGDGSADSRIGKNDQASNGPEPSDSSNPPQPESGNESSAVGGVPPKPNPVTLAQPRKADRENGKDESQAMEKTAAHEPGKPPDEEVSAPGEPTGPTWINGFKDTLLGKTAAPTLGGKQEKHGENAGSDTAFADRAALYARERAEMEWNRRAGLLADDPNANQADLLAALKDLVGLDPDVSVGSALYDLLKNDPDPGESGSGRKREKPKRAATKSASFAAKGANLAAAVDPYGLPATETETNAVGTRNRPSEVEFRTGTENAPAATSADAEADDQIWIPKSIVLSGASSISPRIVEKLLRRLSHASEGEVAVWEKSSDELERDYAARRGPASVKPSKRKWNGAASATTAVILAGLGLLLVAVLRRKKEAEPR